MFISIFTEIITDPIMQLVVVPIKRHISYPFTYKTKVERLQDEAQQLNSKRDRLQQSVADASRRGEEIYDDVSKWLISAGEAIQEAEQLIQAKEQVKERCFIELRRIQAEVAEVLGLDLHEEGILLRANRLNERLNKEKILVILDDIWTKLQLEEVGIPFWADCKGCKILLTSRNRDVYHSMGAQKVLKLEVLREEES
ncbi:hypothetical protein GH714_020187 [Hevea brasiliensis]|uniref:NB-ARC domain-containing protein n=1 Tax=Hevea brasiliensis TaxID=3981 RepID=A0A6A6M2A6_HEVBR|nr:hypothetical protein GH714_020187 [Hevea brasiliensis]